MNETRTDLDELIRDLHDDAVYVRESHRLRWTSRRIEAAANALAAERDRSASPASLALHDAEVKAQALEEAAAEARRKWEPYTCPWVGFLDDRAAAIRGAK